MNLPATEENYWQDLNGAPYKIMLCRDPNNGETILHQHAFCEIYYPLAAKITYQIGDQLLELKAYDIVLIPPHTPHGPVLSSLPQEASHEHFSFWLSPTYIESMSLLYDVNLYRCFDTDWECHQWFVRPARDRRIANAERLSDTVREANSHLPGSDMLVQYQLCRILLLCRRRMERIHAGFPTEASENSISKINEVCYYIQQHCDQKLNLDDLANRFFMNKFYLAHEFKVNMGMSIGQYLTNCRMEVARKMLLRGYPSTKLHAYCGYAEYSSFYRAFKSTYGIGPKEYLKQNTKFPSKV